MKRINDTYFGLNGERCLIHSATKIICNDSVAIEYLKKHIVMEETSENGISQIVFQKIDDYARESVKEAFGNVYEGKEDEYVLIVTKDRITAYCDTDNAVRYAACSIVAHYDGGIQSGILYNSPLVSFRALKVYIPGKDNLEFFREFVDMCMFYGYNTLLIEIGGAMEYKKHPEINEGWVEYCDIFREYFGKSIDVQCSQPWPKNSIHWENGDGGWLTQDTLRELAEYCRVHGLEIIPEVPCFSHCDYMLTRHPELAENQNDPVPDAYCPSNPKTYELLFDLLEEIIDVFKPSIVHIGHDELVTIGRCEKCASKSAPQLYADDITKIHDWLAERGIETMMWGDKLLECMREDGSSLAGSGSTRCFLPTEQMVNIRGKLYSRHKDVGWMHEGEPGVVTYRVPPTHKAISMIPSDIKIMNWYWVDFWHGILPTSEEQFAKYNLWSVYGNFHSIEFPNFFERIGKGIHGVGISNWSKMDCRYLQRNGVLMELVHTSMALWDRSYDETKKDENIRGAAHDMFMYKNARVLDNSYIEVVHGTSEMIPHYLFLDGCLMNDDTDRMGYYHIYYEDGTVEHHDILWGTNIGCITPAWHSVGEERAKERGYLYEPAYSCDYVFDGEETYYRYIIPVTKKVSRVEPDIFEQYADKVFVKEVRVKC